MKITSKQYAESLIEALEEVSENQRELCFDNFAKLVDANNDSKNLPFIVSEAERILEAKSGLREATVTTAFPVSEEMAQSVAKKLESKFNTKVKLNRVVKPDILGGMMVEFNNELLDASTRTWINRLKQALSD